MTRELIEWPFGRSSIGFASLFENLQNTANTHTYPPYNIWQISDSEYRVEIALAGFQQEDITITQHNGQLSVTGEVSLASESAAGVNAKALHKGISNKRFERLFTMNEHMVVESAKMKNGMLVITCKEMIPEELKAKIIKIS